MFLIVFSLSQESLMSLVKEQSSYWIGLSKQNLAKFWLWTDGTRYNDL